MGKALPYAYAVILIAEAVFLLQRYLTNPPGSSAPLSIWAGWISLLSMVVLLIYTVARRARALRNFARLSHWLNFHIFLAFQAVLFGFFHCWHLFFGREAPIQWLNPGVLNGLAVTIVFFSGIFGRYLYSRLPEAMRGRPLTSDEKQNPGAMIFRRWIILHRPLAGILYVLSVVHVILAYMFTPALGR